MTIHDRRHTPSDSIVPERDVPLKLHLFYTDIHREVNNDFCGICGIEPSKLIWFSE
jgi:hypothetical protein